MVDAIAERSGFLSVQPRPSSAGVGAEADSTLRSSLPLIQFSPTRFSFDPELNRVFFQFRDTETGEVTREVPPRVASQAFEITAQSTERAERASLVDIDEGTEEPVVVTTGAPAEATEAESEQSEPAAEEPVQIRSTNA